MNDAEGEPLASPAVALFVDRARASRVDFALTKTNAASVQTLCRRLEGMPLALELAAARARVLSVPEMLEQIGMGLDWLSDVRGGKDTRHQTLRAAIDWSYRLLSATMARLLGVLSVFAGGFTVEAARAVWGDPQVSPSDMLTLLETLCSDSLLFVRQEGGRTRFDMLQSLQAFGQEQLASSGETDLVRQRHLRWFTEWAEAAPSQQDEVAFQRAWADEDNNFRAALEWGMRAKASLEEQTLVTRLARTLPDHFMMRGSVTEGRAFLRRVRDLPLVEPSLQTAARLGEARLAIHQGDYAQATALSNATLTAAQAAGDFPTVGVCFFLLGMGAFHEGDYPLAGFRLQEALQILTALGGDHRKQIAECLLYLGLRHWYQANHAKAKQHLERAKGLYEEMGSRRGVADCLLKLGNVFRDQGDLVTGDALLHEALADF